MTLGHTTDSAGSTPPQFGCRWKDGCEVRNFLTPNGHVRQSFPQTWQAGFPSLSSGRRTAVRSVHRLDRRRSGAATMRGRTTGS